MKSTKKGAPRWLKGIWLTKTLNHDAHVIALPSAIVCTRSVRRLSNQWDLERCGSLEQPPWEFGLATLGSKLVSAKKIIEPATLTYPIANASGGEEPVPEDEAASDPPSPADITDETTLDELAKDAPRAGTTAQAGQGAEEIAEVVEDSPQPEVGTPNPSLPARYAGPPTPFPEPMELGGSASTRSRDLDESGRQASKGLSACSTDHGCNGD